MRLAPLDQDILRALLEGGRNLSANLAVMDSVGSPAREYITQRLLILEDYGLVADVGNGLYSITLQGEIALALFDHRKEDDFERRVRERADRLADDDHLEELIESGAVVDEGPLPRLSYIGAEALRRVADGPFGEYLEMVEQVKNEDGDLP